MSGINFKVLVENLLIEAYSPQDLQTILTSSGAAIPSTNNWIEDIVELHNKMFSQIDIKQDRLRNCLVNGTTTYNAAPKINTIQDCVPLERLYDIFYSVAKKAKVTDIKQLAKFDGSSFYQTLLTSTQNGTGTWELQDSNVRKAYDRYMNQFDVLSQAALETYYNNSIIQTINEIVKKRANVFARISAGRSPFGAPFQALIKDILIYPDQYAAGNKKITSDFKQIIDGVYLSQLIRVGLAAKQFYETVSQPPINLADYTKFLNNQSIDQSTNKPIDYTLKGIEAKKTEEAAELLNTLRNIAHYEREKVGRGERLKYAGQAASALMGFSGQSLYGGPR